MTPLIWTWNLVWKVHKRHGPREHNFSHNANSLHQLLNSRITILEKNLNPAAKRGTDRLSHPSHPVVGKFLLSSSRGKSAHSTRILLLLLKQGNKNHRFAQLFYSLSQWNAFFLAAFVRGSPFFAKKLNLHPLASGANEINLFPLACDRKQKVS